MKPSNKDIAEYCRARYFQAKEMAKQARAAADFAKGELDLDEFERCNKRALEHEAAAGAFLDTRFFTETTA